VKLIVISTAVCLLMVGVLAWCIIVPQAQTHVPEPVPTIPASQPAESTPDHAQPQSPARVGTKVAAAEPVVHWATDPAALDAQHRLERAQQALSENPLHEQALRDKATALADLRQWSPLADTLKRLIELNPHDVGLRYERATVLIQLRQWLDALAELKLVVTQRPEDSRAWFNLAAAHQAIGHLAAARQAWDRVIALSPDTEAHARRGEVLLDLHEWASAAADFEAVLTQQPRAPDATLNLALALAKLDRGAEAQARLLESLAEHPLNVPTLNRLAELAEARCAVAGQTACDEAAQWCRRSLAIDPQQPEVQKLLDATQGPRPPTEPRP
jgi:tetratricopeptide (TPR) repeat protein